MATTTNPLDNPRLERSDDYDARLLPSRELLEAMETDRLLHKREEAVRAAELKLVKRTLDQCAMTEGVNARENCDALVRQFVRMMKTHQPQDYRPLHRAKYFVLPPPSVEPYLRTLHSAPADLTKGEKLYLGQVGVDALNERREREAWEAGKRV